MSRLSFALVLLVGLLAGGLGASDASAPRRACLTPTCAASSPSMLPQDKTAAPAAVGRRIDTANAQPARSKTI